MNFSFFLETFRLGVTNLHLHKLRSFLTTLGIIVGVMAVIAMVAIGEGSKRKTLKQVEQLGSTNIILRSVPPIDTARATRGSPWAPLHYGLRREDFLQIEADVREGRLGNIQYVVPVRNAEQEVVRDEVRATSATSIATTPEFPLVANVSISHGRFLTDEDMTNRNPVCVLGAGVASQLFGPTNPLGQFIRMQSANVKARVFEVVGVMNPVGVIGGTRDQNFDVYFPMTVNEAFFGDTIIKRSSGSTERRVVQLTEIYVRVSDVQYVEPTAAALGRMLEVRHNDQRDTFVSVPRELLRQAAASQQMFNFIMGGIALLSLLVGGIGIMNISLATVTERTREIGIRRALGAKRRHIITQFLVETMCLSVAGGLVGVGAGIGLSVLVDTLSKGTYPTHVTLWSVILAFVISAGVGIIFGIYPAIVAAHQDPIEALRHD